MTFEQAYKECKDWFNNDGIGELDTIAFNMALNALEKQILKKPRETRCALMCANCGHKITEKGCKKRNRLYCKKCGQAINWDNEIGEN